MKILTYTTLFPNAVDSNHGIFVQNRVLHFVRSYQHELQVVAPVPYFPRLKAFERWYRFSQIPRSEVRQGISVLHPRYLITPKVGMTLYGWHMFLGSLATVQRVKAGFDFRVIDAHYLFPDGFAAVLLGKVLKRPVIVSARGTDVHLYSRLRSIRPLLRFVLNHSAAIIAVSQALKDMMMQLGIPEEKIQVIGNGIDVSQFYPGDRLEARHQLGLPLNKTLILSVARMAEVKGIHLLIDAFHQLREQRPETQLILVGSNTDPAYYRSLHERVARKNLQETVHFLGPQSHSALPTWYQACDLLCLCSSREGWPNVLLEAMACGKPVVASRVGGIPEVVVSSDYGLLVDPVNSQGFAAAILAALGTSWDTNKLVNYAREHSWDQVSAKQQRVFQQVVSHS